jgi:hypothetical protein
MLTHIKVLGLTEISALFVFKKRILLFQDILKGEARVKMKAIAK